ncbi:hypothetical protein ANO11243_022020 [Dothideomycetidae sp. 11243]|nr:hypothetical protein ANO11243_022020 [fungal sp. No.11243]
MKERITYILAEGEAGVNPATIEVTPDSLKLPGLRAAKEWRITLSTRDLPQSLRNVLKTVHELHIRWASLHQENTTPPFSSRTPPGLHALYAPLRSDRSNNASHSAPLCDEIKYIFGPELRCGKTEEAFTRQDILSERFAMSPAYQYYQQLPLINNLVDYISANYCSGTKSASSCTDRVQSLQQASFLDFDYDAISQSIVVTAVWPPTRHSSMDRKRSANDRVEIGILNREKATEEEQLSLGGFLTVLGDDDEPKATLFSFPSRHHQLPSSGPESLSFDTSFKQPTGLHPTLQLTFDRNSLEPPNPSCALHTYLTLPSTLFIDRYQLSDSLFLKSQNLVSLRSLNGERDLEAPDWVVRKWGAAALFELAVPEDDQTSNGKPWTVSIPTHLRYIPPKSAANASSMYPEYLAAAYDTLDDVPGKRTVSIPYPVVFWACPADTGLKMATNPFDRVNLGYDGLFGPKTLFWHIQSSAATTSVNSQRLEVLLDAPVLNMDQTAWVDIGTGLAVFLGFAWVCWKLFIGYTTKESTTGTKKTSSDGASSGKRKKQ